MSDNFSVSVELKGKASGIDQIESVEKSIKKVGLAAKETTQLATESARELARAWSASFKGDVTAGLRSGIDAAQTQVGALAQQLRSLYALKFTGNPVANMDDAIKQTATDLATAENELKKLNSLTRITDSNAKQLGTSLAGSFKGDVVKGMREGLIQANKQVTAVMTKLRTLYALRATGNPVEGLTDAIRVVEQELREAQFQVNQLNNAGATSPRMDTQMGVGSLVKGFITAQAVVFAIRTAFNEIKEIISGIASEGLKMNEQLEAFNLGIAANITALYELTDVNGQRLEGEQKYQAALEMSKESFLNLRRAAIPLATTSLEIGKSFQSALAVAGSSGIKDLKTIERLTIGVAAAAQALVIPQEEAVVALRAIITGREVEQSTLARTLVTSGEQVRRWKEQGKLVEELTKRLKPYEEAAGRTAGAWAIVKTVIEETFQIFSGEVMSGFFSQLKTIGDKLKDVLDPQTMGITEKYKPFVDMLERMFTTAGKAFVATISGMLTAVESISAFFTENQEYIDEWINGLYEIWTSLGQIWDVFKDVLVSIGLISEQSGLWDLIATGISVTLKACAISIALIADGARAVGGAFLWVGSQLATSFLEPLAQAEELVGKLASKVSSSWGKVFEDTAVGLRKTYGAINDASKKLNEPFLTGQTALMKLLKSMQDVQKQVGKGIDFSKMLKDIRASISGLLNPQGDDPTGALAKKAQEIAAKVAKAKKEATSALEKARLDAETQLLDDQLKNQRVSISQYYADLQAMQLASLEIERKAKLSALAEMHEAENAPDRIRIQGELNVLEVKRGEIIASNSIKERDALKDLQTQLTNVDTQLKSIMGTTTTGDIATNVAKEFETLKATLTKQFGPDSTQVSLLDNLINVKTAKESFNLIKTEYENTLKEMESKEEEIRKQQSAGTLAPIDAIKQLDDVQKNYIMTLDALIPKLEAYAAVVGSPELQQQVREMKINVQDLKTEQDDFSKTMADAVNSGWVEMWQSFADGTKSAGDAFKDFASGVLSTFNKLMTEIIAKAMMAKMLEGMGQSGGWGAIFSSVFSSMSKADGGYIAGPGTGTSDSIPARLSNGEYVIKAASVRRVGLPFLDALNGGKIKRGGHAFADGGLATSVSPAAATDNKLTIGMEDGLLLKQARTPAFTKVIIEAIENNPSRIRSLLA